MSHKHKSVRIKFFLSACFCWDSGLSLREMDQNLKFGGTLGYGELDLEVFFRQFKVSRLQAILHDGAEAVQAHSGQGPGYFYMFG